MKKILALLLAIALIFSFSACGGEEKDANHFSLGSVSGKTYTNKFINLKFEAPSDWFYYSEDQIAQVNNLTAETVKKDVAEALAKTSASTIMFAGNLTGTKNINIRVEKDTLKSAGIETVDDFAQYYLKQAPQVLKAAGFTVVDISSSTITIGSMTHPVIHMHNQHMGRDLYQNQIIYSYNDVLVIVTVSGTSFDEVASICKGLSHFS